MACAPASERPAGAGWDVGRTQAFEQLWRILLSQLNAAGERNWSRACVDACHVRAEELTPRPHDRVTSPEDLWTDRPAEASIGVSKSVIRAEICSGVVMRVLVTGSSGYIGRAVVRQLLATGMEVTALEHRTGRLWPGNVRIIRGDILQPTDMARAVQGMDAVCHLAADGIVRQTDASVVEAQRRTITVGTQNLLDAMLREQSHRGTTMALVNLSSSAVYGRPSRTPLRSTETPLPKSPYGAAKWEAEQAVGRAVGAGLGSAVSFRLFNAAGRTVCGATPNPAGIIPRAVAAAMGASDALPINGDGTAMRDFIHVRDVSAAVCAGLSRPAPGTHRILNLGARPTSVLEVLDALERICGLRVPVVHRPAAAMDVPYLVADTTDTRLALSWEPEYSTLLRMITEQCQCAKQDDLSE